MNKIKYFRIMQGLQLKDLVIATGLSMGHLSHLENGNRQPSKETMEAVAEALNKTVPEVFYSDFTVEEAEALAAKGYAVHCNDGVVSEIVEEGGNSANSL